MYVLLFVAHNHSFLHNFWNKITIAVYHRPIQSELEKSKPGFYSKFLKIEKR